MGEPVDPFFDDFRDVKAEPPEAERPRRGCLFYGCIGVIILGCLAGLLLAFFMVSMYRFSGRLIEEYTDTAPEAVPVVEWPADRVEAVERRVEAFQESADAGRGGTLSLSAEEINALIARDPKLRGRLAVEIVGDQLSGQVSLPLEELGLPGFIHGGLKGRYLNGRARLAPSITSEGDLAVRVEEMIVRGRPVPDDVLKELHDDDSAIRFELDEAEGEGAFLKHLDDLEVRDGTLILKARSDAPDAVPEPEPDPGTEPPAQVPMPDDDGAREPGTEPDPGEEPPTDRPAT